MKRWVQLRSWATGNAVAALTVSGLLLYVILRFPYSIYYGVLGVSPEEVGLDYISLLSQSTLGVVGVVVVVVVALAIIFFFATYAWMLGVSLRVVPSLPKLRKFVNDERMKNYRNTTLLEMAADPEVGDDVFEAFVHMQKDIVHDFPNGVVDYFNTKLDLAQELRSLRLANDPASLARRERITMTLRRNANASAFLKVFAAEGIRRAFQLTRSIALPVALTVALLGLPFAAAVDANHVKDCEDTTIGQLGLSGFRGYETTLTRMEPNGANVREFPDSRLMLLGRTSDSLVLYDCDRDETVRLPTESQIVRAH